jgi:putative membrane protein
VADSTTTPTGEQEADSPAEIEPDYRFTLANERTFLAWQRTALGLLAAAVALVQLVPELTIPGARRALGVVLAALAILTSGMGLLRWQQTDRAMRHNLPLPRHPTPAYLALGLILVGIVALGLVIAKVVSG